LVTKSQWGIAASLVAVTLVGCSGGNEPSGTYKAADAERLANVAPRTPGWPPWPQTPEGQPPSQSLEELAARDPILAEYLRRTADIDRPDDWSSGNRWADNDKLANLVVDVFDTAADAHVGFLASNDASRGYGAKYGVVVRAEKVEGLGDEAWRLWAHGNGRQVTYHWRRDNLVTEVQVHCYARGGLPVRRGCPSDVDADVDAAGRAWADAVDEEARSVRK
jgi:hypothetical protein